MQIVKEKIINNKAIKEMTGFIVLSAITLFLPTYIHAQWFTGPIVNAILIIALFSVGIRSALVLCLIPSLMALASGLLPAILAPAVPFIMIANVIFVLSIERIYNFINDKRKAYWTAIFCGSILKFIFLFTSVNIISGLLLKQELAIKVAQMMSWPQFATAIIGGMIAWIVLEFHKKESD